MKLGRWIYCKYCYKSVKPELGGIYQVVCSECGYGLTPDFYSKKALKAYLNGMDMEKIYDLPEEKMAGEEIRIALLEGENIFDSNGKIHADDHRPQFYARAISEKTLQHKGR